MNETTRFFAKSIHRAVKLPILGNPRLETPIRPTPKNPMYLSASELGSFDRCRLQWHWSSHFSMRKQGIGHEQGVGILVHLMREHWYRLAHKDRTVRAMQKIALRVLTDTASRKSKEYLDLGEHAEKTRSLAKAMAEGYAGWALDHHDESDDAIGLGKTKAHSEEIFVIPLTKDRSIFLRGKMDLRFEPTHLKRTLCVEEAKTRSGISFDMLDLSNQLTAYLTAMRVKFPGYKRYIAWRTVLRRQMPGPRVTAALFGRESVERTDEEIEIWLEDVKRKATDMLDAAIYPAQRDSCRWDCDFYRLCVLRSGAASKAERREVQDVIDSEFVRK